MTKILRLPMVMQMTGLSRASVYSYIAQGLITNPVKIGASSIGWPESDIAEINFARIAGKPDEEIRALVERLEESRTAAKQHTKEFA